MVGERSKFRIQKQIVFLQYIKSKRLPILKGSLSFYITRCVFSLFITFPKSKEVQYPMLSNKHSPAPGDGFHSPRNTRGYYCFDL